MAIVRKMDSLTVFYTGYFYTLFCPPSP